MNVQILIAFIGYFCVLLGIGLVASRRNLNETDFIMGGRKLNFWLTALSAHASDMSAWLFMAFPAAVFLMGMPATWIALGLIVGMFLNWHFVAPKLRTMTEDLDSYTLSTFFERRFKDSSGFLRIATAGMTLLFMTHYLAAGLMGMGILLESVFGIDYYLGITIATIVMVTYTFIGGYVAVAWTDLFQGLLMLAIVLIVPFFALQYVGGFTAVQDIAQANAIPLSLFPDMTEEWVFKLISFTFGWGVAYFGMPHILTKFMGIRSATEMYKSKWLGMSWQVLALGGATLVGLVAIAFFPVGLDNPHLVFTSMVTTLFHPLAVGVVLCGILAANLSTMDSQILVCATVISEDIGRRILGKAATARRVLIISRSGVIGIAVLSLLIAFDRSPTIMDTVSYAWAGLGCTFAPLVLMALYSKSTNRYGALAGIVGGGLLAAFWPEINPLITQHAILSTVVGFPVSLALIWSVSQATHSLETRRIEAA